MVRTKKIHKEHLLNGAYQLVINEGFKNFHARNVARQIQCSTQPIYREFKNLTEFKDHLCDFIINKIEHFFNKQEINDLATLSQVINDYGKRYPKEFQRFFIEDSQCSEQTEQFVLNHFDQVMRTSCDYAKLNEEKQQAVFKLFWYYTVGKTTILSHQGPEVFLCDDILSQFSTLYLNNN